MTNRIPKDGLWGLAALREAAERDFKRIMQLIEAKLREVLKLEGEEDVWPYVVALFQDRVVVNKNGELVQYDYHLTDDGDVALSNPVEVVETFKPASAAVREATQGAFIEAAGDDEAARRGRRWKVRVIRAGLSGNGNYYPDSVLREAAPLFDGARVFVKGDAEHLRGQGKDFRNLIGKLSAPAFVEGQVPDGGELQATLDVLENAGDVATRMREAWERGMADLFGFSIDAKGRARVGTMGGRTVRVATKFKEVSSVDLIVEPGAGGQVIQLIEARRQEDEDMFRDKVIKIIEAKRPDLLEGKDADGLGDEELEALFTEALAALASAKAPSGKAAKPKAGAEPEEGGITREELAETVRMVEARAAMRAAIADAQLPQLAKDRLRARFEAAATFAEADVAKAITDERDYLARFTESGHVVDLGDVSHIEAGEGRAEKVEQMLDAFFDPENREVISFKECYVAITGDSRVTGMVRHCDEALMREALASGSFANVLGDSITRRMIADYRVGSIYDVWRRLANVTQVGDFRTNERTRFGGYGDLPIVAEGAPYLAVTSPTDEKATYAVAKRGGTETITIEMVKNDDSGVIMRLPVKLARASKRTLAKFVLDFIKDNPAIYDGDTLFHANHGNLGSSALAKTTLAAGRLAMLKQTEKDSGDRLGIGPRSLMVAPDGEETAVDLFRRNTEQDRTFVMTLSLDVLPVWYWTDTNDWALAADPNDIAGLEVAFLDGQEEPEVFVQDSPTTGSLFSHDQVTYKIRHIYGGNVTDFRGFYKAVVA